MDAAEAVESVYASGHELDRLERAPGILEFIRTLEIIDRALPPSPARIADIGGGPGKYAVHYARLGHHVTFRDLMQIHLDETLRRAGAAAVTVDAALGDARQLDLGDETFDAVLLLGPLYHLTDPNDRARTWAEAVRILKPGGVVFAAAISKWAPLLDGYAHKRLGEIYDNASESERTARETGRLTPLFDGDFQAYCHSPQELHDEALHSGLQVIDLVAVEGIGVFFHDLEERLQDPKGREVVLEAARRVERTPELIGLGPHFLVTARKPG